MELNKKVVGKKWFEGTVDVTDPCYDYEVWCRKNNIPIASGNYDCVAWINGEGRVATCGIYMFNYSENFSDFELIGTIGVDAGLAGFFMGKPNYTDSEWEDFCNITYPKNSEHDDAWIIYEGFYTRSGYGDGGYDVYGIYDDYLEKYVALEIRFIEDYIDDEYEYDEDEW